MNNSACSNGWMQPGCRSGPCLLHQTRPRPCAVASASRARHTIATPSGSGQARCGWLQPPRHRHRLAAPAAGSLPGSIQGVIAELQADPTLGPVFRSERLQRALQELREDPGRALAKYSSDKQIMAILARLTQLGLKDQEGAGPVLSSLGAEAGDVAASLFSDGQLAQKLASPRIRAALAEIRANPERGMARYQDDAEVMAVLDALQRQMEGQGGRNTDVIDV